MDGARPRHLQRRRQAEQQSRDHRQAEVERQQPGVGAGVDPTCHVRSHRRQQAVDDPAGDEQADEAARDGQDHAFDKELAHQRRASRAERQADRDLPLPAGRPGEVRLRCSSRRRV